VEGQVARPIAEYDLRDWLRLRPLLHRLKQARYDRITVQYLRLPARSWPGDAMRAELRGRDVMVAVAYEDPQAIEWQSRLVRRFVPRPVYVVADNSHDDAAARAIAEIAAREQRPYLRLPTNPWRGASTSRSHGLALNWLWRNLIRPGEPAAFGFLDDDLFPTAPDDPFAALARQNVFGAVRTAGERWYLWAGFCFFSFAAVRDLALDFGQDWFAGLDTGGANWWPLYRHLERAGLQEQGFQTVPPGVPIEHAETHRVGNWVHEFGTRSGGEHGGSKRQQTAALLRPLLERAAHPA
jgi:hypothetical protein